VVTEVPAKAAEGGDNGEVKPGSDAPTFETMGVTEEQFGKFYSADKGYNWEAHAKEAEFKAAQKPAAPAGDVTPDPNATKDVDPNAAAESAVAAAGLDMDALGVKIRDTGNISDEDYAALEGVGIPKEMVADYVELVNARTESHVKSVHEALGGEQGFKDMQAWAMANLSQDERDGYDAMLNSSQWTVATEALRTQMGMKPVEKQGQLVTPQNQASPNEASSNAYADQAAMNLAIQDPKYKLNTKEGVEYRAEVMRKAANSNWEMQSKRSHNAGL
jgi:hypothetical protein